MRKALAISVVALAVWADSSGCSHPDYDALCADGGQRYDPATGKCVECASDEDCAYEGSGTICAPDNTCGCRDDVDCASSYYAGKVCMSDQHCGCNTDADCPKDAVYPMCVAMSKICGCGSNADCLGDWPLCDTSSGNCVGCLSNADCTDPSRPTCDTTYSYCTP
jgi:hypothetical protein